MTNAENIRIEESTRVPHAEVIALYEANEWSAAKKPVELCKALANSDSLVLAWDGNELVGLGNAISDGHLVVYFPHLLVHPLHHRRGIGRMILERLKHKYAHFHQQMLVADGDAVEFYKSMGFERAGRTEPMWIYSGNDH